MSYMAEGGHNTWASGVAVTRISMLSLIYVTCSAILGLLDRDEDLRASHELMNTERIL